MSLVTINIIKYKPEIGMMSCVGIMRHNFPLSFGNYFSLRDGPYVINMWAENLKEYVKRTGITEIRCTVFEDTAHNKLAYVTDPNIPQEWLNDKLCVTGHGWGSRAICEVVHKFVNLPIDNKICGCEKQLQSPSISQMYSGGSNVVTHVCSNCKRRWESVKNG